jgi:hypothetical protein
MVLLWNVSQGVAKGQFFLFRSQNGFSPGGMVPVRIGILPGRQMGRDPLQDGIFELFWIHLFGYLDIQKYKNPLPAGNPARGLYNTRILPGHLPLIDFSPIFYPDRPLYPDIAYIYCFQTAID